MPPSIAEEDERNVEAATMLEHHERAETTSKLARLLLAREPAEKTVLGSRFGLGVHSTAPGAPETRPVLSFHSRIRLVVTPAATAGPTCPHRFQRMGWSTLWSLTSWLSMAGSIRRKSLRR